MDRLQKLINEVLSEEKKKRDRCLRIADRKFDKPSAYKSGAVVRCRKGDIWNVFHLLHVHMLYILLLYRLF